MPKDTRFRANIANTRADHFGQLYNKDGPYIRSKETRCRERILNTRADHFRQLQKYKYLYPKDIHFRARISNTRGDLFRQHLEQVMTPLFVRVFQTLEVTHWAASEQVRSSQRHPFSCKYFKQHEVTILLADTSTSTSIPRTSVIVRVCQTLEVTISGSTPTSKGIQQVVRVFKHSRTFLAAEEQVHPNVRGGIEVAAAHKQVSSCDNISNTRGGKNKSLHPKDTRFRVRISNTHFSGNFIGFISQGNRFVVRISNTRGDHLRAAHKQVKEFQGHPFSCAYFKHST